MIGRIISESIVAVIFGARRPVVPCVPGHSSVRPLGRHAVAIRGHALISPAKLVDIDQYFNDEQFHEHPVLALLGAGNLVPYFFAHSTHFAKSKLCSK